jgi:prolipoprotein diacylglyceryltransferase
MQPILQIGPLAIPTSPFFWLIALWAGLWLSARRAKQLGLDGDDVYNAGLFGLIAGVVGARLWYVLTHWGNYAGDLFQALSLSRSALSPGAGLVAAGLTVLIYVRQRRVPLGDFGDALAPGLALAILIGQIGAFLGGEGLGAPAAVPWAVSIGGIARHPTQLYQANAAAITLIVLYVSRNWRPWPGFQFWLFVALYSLSRLGFEIFYARPTLVGAGYLAGQVVALAVLVFSLAVMAYHFSFKQET